MIKLTKIDSSIVEHAARNIKKAVTKKDASYIVAKVLKNHELTEMDKSKLYSYFINNMKEESNLIKKMGSLLDKVKYTCFVVFDGVLYSTNGFIIISTPTELEDGYYDRGLNKLPENTDYPASKDSLKRITCLDGCIPCEFNKIEESDWLANKETNVATFVTEDGKPISYENRELGISLKYWKMMELPGNLVYIPEKWIFHYESDDAKYYVAGYYVNGRS